MIARDELPVHQFPECIQVQPEPKFPSAAAVNFSLKPAKSPKDSFIALKTLSIEWKHSHPRGCVAALHPGPNDTALSEPFQANVAPQNLFKPAYTAGMFVKLLSKLDPAQSGKFWAWDGNQLPW
jgi:hypothetical protein